MNKLDSGKVDEYRELPQEMAGTAVSAGDVSNGDADNVTDGHAAPPAEATSGDDSAIAATDVSSSTACEANVKVDPLPQLPPKHRVDLRTVAMSTLSEVTPVESLMVQELKGIASQFTPNLDLAMQFHVIIYKPAGEFEATHHILAGKLLEDPRITNRARVISFVPAFNWSTCETVIMPIKMTKFGAHVLRSLDLLRNHFPNFKVFVEWSDQKRRHVVNKVEMTQHERELISKTEWPTKEAILEALQSTAFDNINDLASENHDIRTLLDSQEVE